MPAVPASDKGEGGGGLRDFERRASSWRNGIGENSGVDGGESRGGKTEEEGEETADDGTGLLIPTRAVR